MLVETIAVALGSALAKQLTKEWVGDESLVARIATELGKSAAGLQGLNLSNTPVGDAGRRMLRQALPKAAIL
jgi:hypothetical protein